MAVPPLKAHQIDYSRFIPFHPGANADSGRKVYIDPQLMRRFLELIDFEKEAGLTLASDIVGKLKSVAGGATSDSNLQNAAQHRDHFIQHNVIVTYSILQNTASYPSGGVFVTDLESAVKSEKDQPPGFYKVEFSSSRLRDWDASPSKSSHLETTLGVIGASDPDLSGEVSLNNSANDYGEYLSKNDGRRVHEKDNYSLFYTPTYTIDSYGRWLGSAEKQFKGKASPTALANIFLATENQFNYPMTDERYCWYVFGDGAKQLVSALKEYRLKKTHLLSRHHDFIFVAPKVPIGELKTALNNVGIELTADMLKLADAPPSAKLNMLACDSGAFGGFHRSDASEKRYNDIMKLIEKARAPGEQQKSFADIVKDLSKAVAGGWI